MGKWQVTLERLQAHEPKALIDGAYEHRGLCCAVSVLLPATKSYGDTEISIKEIMRKITGPTTASVRIEAKALGLKDDDLLLLQRANDDQRRCTPEERYQRVLTWVAERAEVEREREHG